MERLRVGVVGLRRGLTHVRNFLRLDDVELIAVADRYPLCREKAQEMLAAAGTSGAGTKIVSEYDDLLALRPDAVCIATNGKLQVQHACQALEAGCHVLSEVPGAYSTAEWIHLRDTVQRAGRIYMLAENSAFLDFLRYWRKWIVEGRLGAISIAEGEYLHYLPQTLQGPDGNRFSPSVAIAQGRTEFWPIWRADQPPIQYLTHDLGPLLEVLDDRCVSVICRSAPWRCKEAPLRSDGQIALFETAKGNLIQIMVTLNTVRPSEHRYRLFGTDGSAEWFSFEGFCRRFCGDRAHKAGWERVNIGSAAVNEDRAAGHGGTDLKTVRHFVNTVLHGKPNPIDIYRAIEYSLPGILANRSAKNGGTPIAIPDMRDTPFCATRFWDVVGLPDADPPSPAE